MLGAEGVDGEPHIRIRPIAKLAQHGGVALVRSDDHAAEEEQDRASGGLFRCPDDQAREAVHHFLFVARLAVRRHKEATASVRLFDGLQQLILWQGESLFRAGELVSGAQQ